MIPRLYTSKQMGDACEMLIAGELTLAGIPALKMPDNWPGYDVIAQPKDGGIPQRISVKSRTFKRGGGTFVYYDSKDQFDWLAIVLLAGADQKNRRIFIIPRDVADQRAKRDKATSKDADSRYWRQDKVAEVLAEFENNFCLSPTGPLSSTWPLGKSHFWPSSGDASYAPSSSFTASERNAGLRCWYRAAIRRSLCPKINATV